MNNCPTYGYNHHRRVSISHNQTDLTRFLGFHRARVFFLFVLVYV
jgi:hypothetical protein